MGRTAQFDREELLLTAASVAAAGRPLTIQSLAEATGAPVGSIYHRFESREALLAEAWLLAVRHFQTCLLYTSPSPRDGLLSRMPSSA